MATVDELAAAAFDTAYKGPSNGGFRWEDVPTSSIGAGLGAGWANYRAGMGALAQALGFDTRDYTDRMRERAAFFQRNAPGATEFFGEQGVMGEGELLDWLAYNLGQSAPYMLEAIASGGVGGAIARKGATEALKRGAASTIAEQASKQAGKEALTAETERALLEAAARNVATARGATTGLVAGTYPSAVGDILLNQIEAGNELNLPLAAAGGVPYALLNVLGGEGAAIRAATGGLARKGATEEGKGFLRQTLEGTNFPGSAARAVAKTGFMEGVGETGQEVINQAFGQQRDLLEQDALKRYAESFMAGMGMGGIMGGGASVFAKPQLSTPEEIAKRKEGLQRSVEAIQKGNATDLEIRETAAEIERKIVETGEAQAKEKEDAFYAEVQREEDAKKEAAKEKEKRDSEMLRLMSNIVKQRNEKQGKEDDPWIRLQVARDTAAEKMNELVSLVSQSPPDVRRISVVKAEQAAAQAEVDSLLASANNRQAPSADGGLMSYLSRINSAFDLQSQTAPSLGPSEQLDAFNLRNGVAVPTDIKGQIAEIVAEREYEGRVAQFNENQALARAGQQKLDFTAPVQSAPKTASQERLHRLQTIRDRQRVIEAEAKRRGDVKEATRAAYDALDAEKAMQEEMAWQQLNAEPLHGVTPDMFGRPVGLTPPNQPASLDKEDTMRSALMMSMLGSREIPAASDALLDAQIAMGLGKRGPQARERLSDAQADLDQLQGFYDALQGVSGFDPAVGFGKQEGTDEMFNRKSERSPMLGEAASGNMFKSKKGKASGAKTAETKQAEPAAPAQRPDETTTVQPVTETPNAQPNTDTQAAATAAPVETAEAVGAGAAKETETGRGAKAEEITNRTNLLGKQFVHHAVRSDEDLDAIFANGANPGLNLSAGTSGQAFMPGNGDTILVFRKADVAPRSKGYQADLTSTARAKPVAILKETSLETDKPSKSEEEAELDKQADAYNQQLEMFAKTLGISIDEFNDRRYKLIGKAAFTKEFGELGDRIFRFGKEEERLWQRIEDAENLPETAVTTQDVLARYAKYGAPVRQVTMEYNDANDSTTVTVGEAFKEKTPAEQLAAKFNARKTLTPEEAQRVRDEELAAQEKPVSTPYDEGAQAAKDGVIVAANPYGTTGENAKAWANGWLDTNYPSTKETQNANEVESPASVPVGEQPQGGEEVRAKDAKKRKVAKKGKTLSEMTVAELEEELVAADGDMQGAMTDLAYKKAEGRYNRANDELGKRERAESQRNRVKQPLSKQEKLDIDDAALDGKVLTQGAMKDETAAEMQLDLFDATTDTPWLRDKLKNRTTLEELLSSPEWNGALGVITKAILSLAGIKNVGITYVDKEETNKAGQRVGGRYFPADNAVEIYRGGADEHTVMHEVVHAVTLHRLQYARQLIERLSNGDLTELSPEQAAIVDAYNKLDGLRDLAKTAAMKRGLAGQFYGLTKSKNYDVEEFVSEALTDAPFQAFLRSVQVEKQAHAPSVWQSVVRALKSVLGIPAESESILARVLELFPEIVSTRTEMPSDYRVPRPWADSSVLAGPVMRPIIQLDQAAKDSFSPSTAIFRKALEHQTSLEGKSAAGRIARGALLASKRAAETGLRWVHTMRGWAKSHPQLNYLVEHASEMLKRKENVMSSLNVKMREFLIGMRQGWKGDYSEEGQTVNSALEATLNLYSEGLPEKLTALMEDLAQLYMRSRKEGSGDNPIFGFENGVPELKNVKLSELGITEPEYKDKTLRELTRLSEKQLREGVKIANQNAMVKLEVVPGEAGDAFIKKVMGMYNSAMDTMVVGHLQRLASEDKRATELLGTSMEDIRRRYAEMPAEVLDTVTKLRMMYDDHYRRTSKLDITKRRTLQLSKATDLLLEQMNDVIYAIVRKQATTGNDSNYDFFAKQLNITEAEAKKLVAPLIKQYEALDEDEQKQFASALRDDVTSASQASRAKEARVYTAMKEMLGMYLPARRHGDYTARLGMVDKNGNFVTGLVTMPDGTKKQSEAVLDVWQYGNSTVHDAYDVLTRTVESLNKDLDAEDRWFTIEAPVYEGNKKAKGEDKVTTKPIKVKLQWMKPEATKQFRTLALRMPPVQMLNSLEILGIRLPPAQRERIIVGTTNQEAAIRGKLMRNYTPGYRIDFNSVLSDYLGSVASSIAISEYAHRLQRMATNVDKEWDWNPLDEQALKDAKAQFDKYKGTPNEQFYRENYERLAVNKRKIEATQPHLNKVLDQAREYVEYILQQDQLDERNTMLTKARAVVTIAQLGGSIASAVTNISSLPLHTLNYLATYSSKRAFGGGFGYQESFDAIKKASLNKTVLAALRKNMKPFVDWKNDELYMSEEDYKKMAEQGDGQGYSKEHWEFMQRASEEGVIGAQNHNELLSLRKHAAFGPRGSKFASHYMSIFTASEEFNRTVTALAAFDLYFQRALKADPAKGDAKNRKVAAEYAYKQAIKAVYETQGEYNQINRPKLFRSDLGALVFLYKTFAVTTLELLRNMPPKGQAVFLGTLFAFSGIGGIPLLEEAWIVVDLFTQKTGIGLGITKGNAERALLNFVREAGKELGIPHMDEAVARGVLDTAFGTEVFGRAGVQVGVPLIGAFRPGAKLAEEIGRTLGAFGGALEGADTALGKLTSGDLEGAFRAVPITLVKNFADAYSYAKYDAMMNKRGQVVAKDPDAIDIFMRMAGFYPAELKWINDQVRREEMTRAYTKEVKGRFVEEYREAAVRKDPARMREIEEMVREHNQIFRGSALEIMDFMASARKSAKDSVLSLRERAFKTLPKAQQQDSPLGDEEE